MSGAIDDRETKEITSTPTTEQKDAPYESGTRRESEPDPED